MISHRISALEEIEARLLALGLSLPYESWWYACSSLWR